MVASNCEYVYFLAFSTWSDGTKGINHIVATAPELLTVSRTVEQFTGGYMFILEGWTLGTVSSRVPC